MICFKRYAAIKNFVLPDDMQVKIEEAIKQFVEKRICMMKVLKK